MLSLIRREFFAYFLSPIAYVVLAVFLLVTGHLFYLTMLDLTETGPRGIEFPMQRLLGDERFWLVFLFIPPLLTMRLFAEERGTGTLEMLMTAPVRDWQVVAAKFISCFLFYLLLWLPTLAYLPVLLDLKATWQNVWTGYSVTMVAGVAALLLGVLMLLAGQRPLLTFLVLLMGALAAGLGGWLHYTKDAEKLVLFHAGFDPYPLLSSYLGVALAGAMFLALGLFVSSLVRSQMVAALVSLVLSLGFILAGFWKPELQSGGMAERLMSFFSVPQHFSRDFCRGLIDTRHLVLYLTVTAFCLFLTVRSLERRRYQ